MIGAGEKPTPTGGRRYEHVHVIINPAAGKEEPILNILNDVFQQHRVDWDAFVTHGPGDAQQLTELAIRDRVDAVAVYGGDGTVMEVVAGLEGRDIPVAILPGGNANLLAKELGIPLKLADAAALLGTVPTLIQPLDMGVVGGYLFFRLGIGFQADLARENSSPGIFSALFAMLRDPVPATYRLQLDGTTVEHEAIGCLVTTYGKLPVPGLTLAHAIDPSDGLLDVILIQEANLKTVLQAAAEALREGEMADSLLQWQVKEVNISVTPPQSVLRDGELITPQTLDVHVVPQTAPIIVPA
ncbi:MAG TPA: diacylglycerol kinase family protein [Aggregatilineaceae bacterium]|nr:diacylglycerol kinase family protein [Aggregatilineaceae bacterium]